MLRKISISTDKEKLDVNYIYNYLSTRSYWAKGRTLEDIKTTIENSISFGVFYDDKQVGFARVVTDRAVFAYIADVFIDENYRKHGISKKLMSEILSHPYLKKIPRWLLATLDAHTLYAQFGFKPLAEPGRFMEIKPAGQ